MSETEQFLRIDEQRDVLCSLELCRDALKSSVSNTLMWKWVIISLHNAVHGAMVCHLTGSMNIGAQSSKKIKETIAYFDNPDIDRSDYPGQYLAAPEELLKRLRREYPKSESAGDILEISEEERNAFEKLNYLRRELLHFKPGGWSIQLKGYVDQIAMDTLSIFSKILKCEYAFRHLEEFEISQLKSVLDEIKSILVGVKSEY